jgi:hypothetical protein
MRAAVDYSGKAKVRTIAVRLALRLPYVTVIGSVSRSITRYRDDNDHNGLTHLIDGGLIRRLGITMVLLA